MQAQQNCDKRYANTPAEHTFLQRGTSSSLYGGSSIEGSVRRLANILPNLAAHSNRLTFQLTAASNRCPPKPKIPLQNRRAPPAPASHPSTRQRRQHCTIPPPSRPPMWHCTAAQEPSATAPTTPPSFLDGAPREIATIDFQFSLLIYALIFSFAKSILR